MVESPPHKCSKNRNAGSFSPCRDTKSLEWYKKIFSRRSFFNERFLEDEALYTAKIFDWIENIGWLPIFAVKGLVQEDVVRIFYENSFDIN